MIQRTEREVVENPISPYTYKDFVTMENGALLTSLAVYRKEIRFAPDWYISSPATKLWIEKENRIKLVSFRGGVENIQHKFYGKYSNSNIFSVESLSRELGFDRQVIEVKYKQPIGIYLGNILRTPLGFYVQVLVFGHGMLWI